MDKLGQPEGRLASPLADPSSLHPGGLAISPLDPETSLLVDPAGEPGPPGAQPASGNSLRPNESAGLADSPQDPDDAYSHPSGGSQTPSTTSGRAAAKPPQDRVAPDIGPLAFAPETIWAEGSCRTRSDPVTLAAAVSAKDNDAVESVALKWAGPIPGVIGMRVSGGTYTATVGPFPQRSLPMGATVTVPVTATATDSAGNSSSSSGAFTLRCR
ncbi:MAG: hypothetical protein ACRDIU_09795 [Actinomycetota bacterium]